MEYKTVDEFIQNAGYDIEGTWMPRVTKIVEIKAKPALYKFYGGLSSFEQGEAIKARSAQEGTLVHETIEGILMNSSSPIPPEAQSIANAFLAFQEQQSIVVRPEFVEYRIAHQGEKYAGTIDAVATIGGKTGVLDIKTSQSIYRDYNLQTAAYMAALENEIPRLETRWILRIDQHRVCSLCGALLRSKGGVNKVRPQWNGSKTDYARSMQCQHQWSSPVGDIELKEFPHWKDDFRAFLGAKALWEWEHEDVLKKIGYLKG